LTPYIAIWKYSFMAIRHTGDSLSLTFGALADPTRRAILARLASEDADVSQLTATFDLRQPTISKHLSVLERAGLVKRGRDAQRRPRTFVAAPLKDADDWIEPFRQFWELRFAALDEHLKQMQKAETPKKGKPRAHAKRRGRPRQEGGPR
jgi:DNA-binding transcriptional ArsR family regulator